ncbi:hypothetical protein BHM03_00034348 [Ensete ventricosum]|nr:hypothetical protein BHM03_00034348 [Ensete ventricosum]
MASAWRVDGSSEGCCSGGEALEMKRRRKVRLEGNSGSAKVAVEDGSKGGAATSSSMEAQGKDSDSWSCDCSEGVEMATPSRGRRWVGAGATVGECTAESDMRQLG